ncbi:hypothetical protein ACEQPO_26800 [Bacillus sp. SL00103]
MITSALSLFPRNINEVFYYSTLLGYALFVVLAIPFITAILLMIRKNGEVDLARGRRVLFIFLSCCLFLLSAGC